jgi:hypothetical protein
MRDPGRPTPSTVGIISDFMAAMYASLRGGGMLVPEFGVEPKNELGNPG